MNLILNIDTAVDVASVCLAGDGKVLQYDSNKTLKDHASWLHPAISKLLMDSGFSMPDLKAVAVSIGPGSYTGLRIGLSSAKGICYALNIPLIAIGTLDMMAFAVKDEGGNLICPMIDARRMEVFTALYDKDLKQLTEPSAMVIDENSFSEHLSAKKIIFHGNGSNKLRPIITNSNAVFSPIQANAVHLAELSSPGFIKQEFADLAYIQPLYVKEFFMHPRKALP